MTNQESIQNSIRIITGTSGSYNEDWEALFDLQGISSGTFNERFIEWLQFTTGTSKTNINDLKAEYASQAGFNSWNDVNNIIPFPVSSIVLWQDGADTSSINTTELSGTFYVDNWLDKSGQGNHSTQTIPTAKPTTGATTLNGKNVLDFDGSDALNINSSLLSIPSGNSTLFAVAKRNSEAGTAQDIIQMFNAVSGAVCYGIRYGIASGNIAFYNGNGINITLSSGTSNANFKLITCYREGINFGVSANGGTPATSTFALNALATSAQIGASGINGLFLSGSIAEILLFNTKLTTAQINNINLYLANKWGIY